jgi:GNAT superfamily N-acetyltransferase
MRLRRAEEKDRALLVSWSRDFEHGAHGAPFIERTFELFAQKPERGEIVILTRDSGESEPVGYAILIPWWSNEFRGEALLLDELYVAPGHRGGTGAAALEAIEERARSRGVRVIALEVLPGSKAHGLYQRAGFTSGRTLYQKPLA